MLYTYFLNDSSNCLWKGSATLWNSGAKSYNLHIIIFIFAYGPRKPQLKIERATGFRSLAYGMFLKLPSPYFKLHTTYPRLSHDLKLIFYNLLISIFKINLYIFSFPGIIFLCVRGQATLKNIKCLDYSCNFILLNL
jgi:hypothetical protein